MQKTTGRLTQVLPASSIVTTGSGRTNILTLRDDKSYNQDWEVVFQTVRAPLSAFQSAGNSKVFDPSKLRIVRLMFDRTPMYKLCISSIGFGKQRFSR